MSKIFTVGHSRHAADRFLALLRAHAIEQIVDVRSQPVSKWAPHFNQGALAKLLGANDTRYVFLGSVLGGRPKGGTVDYALRAVAADFQDGIAQIVDLSRERQTAILCAEEDPTYCHRRLLVSPALRLRASTVVHIRGDGRLASDDGCDPAPTRQLDLF